MAGNPLLSTSLSPDTSSFERLNVSLQKWINSAEYYSHTQVIKSAEEYEELAEANKENQRLLRELMHFKGKLTEKEKEFLNLYSQYENFKAQARMDLTKKEISLSELYANEQSKLKKEQEWVFADTRARLNGERDQALALKDSTLRSMEIVHSALEVKNRTYTAALAGETPNLEPLIFSINDALDKIKNRLGSMSELQAKKAKAKNLHDQLYIRTTERTQKTNDLEQLRRQKEELEKENTQLKEKLGGLDPGSNLVNLDDQLQRYNELIHILMTASFKRKATPNDVAIYQQVPIQDMEFLVKDDYISLKNISKTVMNISDWHIADNLERCIFEFKTGGAPILLQPLKEIKVWSPSSVPTEESQSALVWKSRSNKWASNNYDFTVFYWVRHSLRRAPTSSHSQNRNDPQGEGPEKRSKK